VNSQVAKNDDKTDRLNSDEWSQSKTEISKNNRRALIAELTDKEDNDTALTNIAQQHHQNKQEQIHDPITSHAHTEDIAPAETKDTSSLIVKSP
jgi:hypothetical protein